jgi:hypothetical protein
LEHGGFPPFHGEGRRAETAIFPLPSVKPLIPKASGFSKMPERK